MSRLKRLLSITQILFLISIAVQFLPDKISRPGERSYAIELLLFIEGIQILTALLMPESKDYKTWNGVFGFVFTFIAIWTLLTAKFNMIPEDIFKAPDIVTEQFVKDRPRLMKDLHYSLSFSFSRLCRRIVGFSTIQIFAASHTAKEPMMDSISRGTESR